MIKSLVFVFSLFLIFSAGAKLKINYSYNSSDNLAQNKNDKIKGNFSDLDLTFVKRARLGQDHSLLYALNANKKIHHYSLHRKNFDQNNMSIEIGNEKYFNSYLSGGLGFYFLKHSGRIIDFVTNSTDGRVNRFDEKGINLEINWRENFTLKPFYGTRKYETLSNDENSNLFKDDYDLYGVKIDYEKNLTERMQFTTGIGFEEKKYSDRNARFTEGTLDNSDRNPHQELRVWSLKNSIDYQFDFFKVKYDLFLSFQDDLIFGALDYNGILHSLSLNLPLGPFATFSPTLQYGKHTYDNFVADVINNPQSTELRIDKMKSLSFPVKMNSFLGQLTFTYTKKKIESNYPLEGYDEKVVSLGVTHEIF